MFQTPTNLDPHEHVWLVLSAVDAPGEVQLNGRVLGTFSNSAAMAEFEITPLLAPRNELLLEIAGSIWNGEVRLEVRAAQYLDRLNVLLADSGQLRVTGCVAGEAADGPFEIVVRDAQQELLYAEVGWGTPFELIATEEQAGAPTTVDVRLIRGGTRIWESRVMPAMG